MCLQIKQQKRSELLKMCTSAYIQNSRSHWNPPSLSHMNAYNSVCPTLIHRDLEQGVFRSHSHGFAGDVTRGREQGRRQGGVGEGGRHREDKVAIGSAGWRTNTHGQTSADKLKLCGSKGETSQEAIDDYTQGIRDPFHLLRHWQAELH